MKRIICDFDDTLAFTTNRDWDNAIPNLKLIEKLNELFNLGWIIDIYTARGSLSQPSREAADITYRPQIESWLKQHSVNYSSLSFEKPLATYYIDDKGIKPEEFVNLNLIPLFGLSGSDIYAFGNEVYKTEKNPIEVVNWYKATTNLNSFNVPKIHSVIGDTIKMEYIDNIKLFDIFKENRVCIYEYSGKICSILDEFSTTAKTTKYNIDSYINRIKEHTNLIDYKIFKNLDTYSIIKDLTTIMPKLLNSFAHGDFSIDNILVEKDTKELYLIDPINSNFFSSFEIDAAKFMASTYLHFDTIEMNFSYLENSLCFLTNLSKEDFYTLMSAELIRTLKYSDESRKIRIYNLFKLWNRYV